MTCISTRRIALLVFLVLKAFNFSANAQIIEPAQDSIIVIQPDSKNKKKIKPKRLNFRSFFSDKSEKATTVEIGYRVVERKPLIDYEGKIIRNINITTLDPFDYSIEGESEEKINFLLKLGNKLHIQTKQAVIRNFLLFGENQPFDSLLIRESERLIRSQPYVREVAIVLSPIANQTDSVDIVVYELDRWSLVPRYASTTNRSAIGLTEANIFGYGQSASFVVFHDRTDNDAYLAMEYFVPNIKNTYISAKVIFGADEYRNITRGAALERTFFSPATKWGAGISFIQQYRSNPKYANDSVYELQTYELNTHNYWFGWSFPVLNKSDANYRTTRLITSARYLNVDYLKKSIEPFDSLNIFTDEQFYLGSIGISARRYSRDKFIFDYGITEDVPYGGVLSFTGGYQIRNAEGRYYAGTRLSFGNYIKWGYMSTNVEYGTFLSKRMAQQGTFVLNINYFTNLIKLGSWTFRQFAKVEATIGINRFVYEKLNLETFYTPGAFNNYALLGSNRILFTMQSQFYAPYKLLGFRLAPYTLVSVGMIGQSTSSLLSNKFYSQFGVGVLITNLNLVFNTLQLALSFYPTLPDGSRNAFGINPFKSSDFGFRDFELNKPTTVIFK